MKSLEMQIHFIHCGPDIVLIFACMLHWVIYLFHTKARNAANLHAFIKISYLKRNEMISICISKNFVI